MLGCSLDEFRFLLFCLGWNSLVVSIELSSLWISTKVRCDSSLAYEDAFFEYSKARSCSFS